MAITKRRLSNTTNFRLWLTADMEWPEIDLSLELLGHGTCPKTESGLPKCFFSLVLAVELLLPFLVHFAKSMRITAKRS